MLFKNEFHEDFGTWPLAYIPFGGADFGEVRAVADGDDSAFHDAFVAAGDRLKGQGDEVFAKGHETSARESYLRASVFYAASFQSPAGRLRTSHPTVRSTGQISGRRPGLSSRSSIRE